MKKQDLVLLVILASSLFVGSFQTQANDSPAVINDIYFSHTNATIGDIVTIYVDIQNNHGISYIEANLYSNISDPEYYNNYLLYVPLSEDGTGFSGSFEVLEYYPLDIFVYEIYYSDNAVNYGWLYHNSDFISPSLFTYGTNPDDTAPVLHSVWFGQATATGGDMVNVYVNASDDKSGISYIYADIYRAPTNPADYYWNGAYINTVFFAYEATSDLWVGIWEVNEFLSNSTYQIPWLSMADNAQNWIYYENYTFAENLLIPPTIEVMNERGDSNPPILHDFFFASESLSVYETQYIYSNITDDLSGLDYGWLSVAYYDALGNPYYVGDAYVDSYQLDPETGLYKSPVYYYSDVPSNTTLFVDQSYLYDKVRNYDSYFNGLNFTSPTYYITAGHDVADPTVDFFTISLTPDEGVNDVGQEVIFTVTLDNNRSRDVWGEVYLDIFGPEDFTILSESYYVSSHDTIEFTMSVVFNKPGDYELVASTNTEEGYYYETVGIWTVNERQVEQAISLTVDPHSGKSVVNESVEFHAKVESTFLHAMDNITLTISVESTSGFNHEQTLFFDLPAQASVDEMFSIIFPEVDDYHIKVVVTDDIGTQWITETDWVVVEDTDTDPDHTDTNTETNGTDTHANTTDTPSNSSDAPQIELPGFELSVAIFSFSFLLITTHIRRRRL